MRAVEDNIKETKKIGFKQRWLNRGSFDSCYFCSQSCSVGLCNQLCATLSFGAGEGCNCEISGFGKKPLISISTESASIQTWKCVAAFSVMASIVFGSLVQQAWLPLDYRNEMQSKKNEWRKAIFEITTPR